MTNHIEELMKAVGAETKTESYCKWECEKPALETSPICHDADCLFRKIRTFYPAFTPEKQLELIKLIGQQSGFQIHQNEGMDWLLSDSIYADLSFNTQGYSYSSFENALCKLTINLLKKKALNKSEVKRILEDD